MNILIVEDEWVTGTYLKKVVLLHGHKVHNIVDNGQEAIEIVQNNDIDLILMDININGSMDGIACAKTLNKTHDIPIIFITAHNDSQTIDESLDTNICGFVNKPFQALDIEIALKIALKRIINDNQEVNNSVSSSIIPLGGMYAFDVEEMSLKNDGVLINLTKTERKFLFFLASNKDSILAIDKIANYIWGVEEVSDSSLRNVIYKLRKKVPELLIESIHVMGYILRTK